MFVYYFGKMTPRNVNIIREWYAVGEEGMNHYFTEYREYSFPNIDGAVGVKYIHFFLYNAKLNCRIH